MAAVKTNERIIRVTITLWGGEFTFEQEIVVIISVPHFRKEKKRSNLNPRFASLIWVCFYSIGIHCNVVFPMCETMRYALLLTARAAGRSNAILVRLYRGGGVPMLCTPQNKHKTALLGAFDKFVKSFDRSKHFCTFLVLLHNCSKLTEIAILQCGQMISYNYNE